MSPGQKWRTPGSALMNALEMSSDADQAGPMFVYKDKRNKWRPYLYNHFLCKLKKMLSAIGLDSKLYAGHSLRRGGATWALKCGVPGEIIKSIGDWRSMAYLQYLDVNCHLKLQYATHMSGCLPKWSVWLARTHTTTLPHLTDIRRSLGLGVFVTLALCALYPNIKLNTKDCCLFTIIINIDYYVLT